MLAAATARPSSMTGTTGTERIALCAVSVSAVLDDLLTDVTLTQTYRNDEAVPIEAVYTFPLPLDAVLTDVHLSLGSRSLRATVVERRQAERRYEQAVEDGHAAVMLQAIEPGLYTLNLGNLLPGESAMVRLRYALLHRWTGDRMRLLLPMAIAPRYGHSPHAPHQAPVSALNVEHRFSLQLELRGALREARLDCPSHALTQMQGAERVLLGLQQAQAAMDRDLVLGIQLPQAGRGAAQCGVDGDGVSVLASFQPLFPGLRQARPLAMAIVVDCSGSMAGDSIEQARQALDTILQDLQPQDRVNLIPFGDRPHPLCDRLMPCSEPQRTALRRRAQALDANLGGTEIGAALDLAHAQLRLAGGGDVFLITDGGAAHWEPVVARSAASGQRVFTVGVGSAVSEPFVRALAERTGGGCELVAPGEGMAERVVRHFGRMRAPRARRVTVHWPAGATQRHPQHIGAVFEGDTVLASAVFADARQARGHVVLEVEPDGGTPVRMELPLPAPAPTTPDDEGLSTVARLAAAARLDTLTRQEDAHEGLRTALRYRLASPWTHWLVVAERADANPEAGMPALRQVPQMLAAGWGGTGSVLGEQKVLPASMAADYSMQRSTAFGASFLSQEHAYFDALLYAPTPERLAPPPAKPDLLPYQMQLLLAIEARPDAVDVAGALDLLQHAGADAPWSELLAQAPEFGVEPHCAAARLLLLLLEGPLRPWLSEAGHDAARRLRQQFRQAMQTMLAPLARVLAHTDAAHDGDGRRAAAIDRIDSVREWIRRAERYGLGADDTGGEPKTFMTDAEVESLLAGVGKQPTNSADA